MVTGEKIILISNVSGRVLLCPELIILNTSSSFMRDAPTYKIIFIFLTIIIKSTHKIILIIFIFPISITISTCKIFNTFIFLMILNKAGSISIISSSRNLDIRCTPQRQNVKKSK